MWIQRALISYRVPQLGIARLAAAPQIAAAAAGATHTCGAHGLQLLPRQAAVRALCALLAVAEAFGARSARRCERVEQPIGVRNGGGLGPVVGRRPTAPASAPAASSPSPCASVRRWASVREESAVGLRRPARPVRVDLLTRRL